MKFFVLEEKVCGEWKAAYEELTWIYADTREDAADILLPYDYPKKYRVREYVRAKKKIKSRRET